MDYSQEHFFVQSFIRKPKRERLLYELTTPEKRYAGVSRFCHSADELLDPSRIILSGKDLESQPAFADFVMQHDELCLVLSPEFWLDEQFLPLKEAVAKAAISLDAVLIIGSTFAVVFTEAAKGGRDKYLLSIE